MRPLLFALPALALLAACGAPPMRELHGGGVGNIRHWNGEEFSLRASTYRGMFEAQQAAPLMLSFRHGRAEFAGQPVAPGCHLLNVQPGQRLFVNVRDLDMRFPGDQCPEPDPPGVEEMEEGN